MSINSRYKGLAWATLALAAAAGAAVYMASTFNPDSSLRTELTPLTSHGDITEAALSPDGTRLFYGRDEGNGSQSLWLAAINRQPERVSRPEGLTVYSDLAFSLDSGYVYYTKYRGTESAGGFYRLQVGGGAEVQIKENVPRFFAPMLSPDGDRLAFISRSAPRPGAPQESALVVRNVSDGTEKRVGPPHTADYYLNIRPAWKPDAKSIVCAARNADPNQINLVEIRVADGTEQISATLDVRFLRHVAWLADGSGLLVSTSDHEHGPYQIKYISYPDAGVEQKVTTDARNNYVGMSMSLDSRALVTVRDTLEASAWLAEREDGEFVIKGRLGVEDGGHNDFFGFAWAPDGKGIVYESSKGGRQNIYLLDLERGGEPKNLTNNVGDSFDPCVASKPGDDNFIVFASNRTGRINLWRMGTDGQNLTLLTRGDKDIVPYCSPDGAGVYYTAWANDHWTLRKVAVEGGRDQPVPREDRILFWPALSPDGKRLVSFYDDGNKISLAVLSDQGEMLGNPIPVPASANTWGELRWVTQPADGALGVSYVDTRKDGGDRFTSDIWFQPLGGGGEPRHLTRNDWGRIFRYALSADGERLVFSRGKITRDVFLVNIVRPTKLDDLRNQKIVQAALQHRWLILAGLSLLLMIFVVEFTSLPLDLLTNQWPTFNSAAWLLYKVRGGDWRIFRNYRESLKSRLASNLSFYVPLPVILEGHEAVEARSVQGRLLELIKKDAVLITGSGGAGKSTLLSRLALSALDDVELKSRLPVFLNASAEDGTSLRSQLVTYMKSWSIYVNDAVLDTQMKKGMFFFIIDGVGEATEQRTRKMLEELPKLFPQGGEKAQQSVVALASRYFDDVKLRLNDVDVPRSPCRVELKQVDEGDLGTFCLKYLAAKRRRPEEEVPAQEAASLAERLKTLPLTPLIITLAIDEYEQRGLVPSTAVGLFENYLYHVSRDETLQITKPALFDLLHHLAWKKFFGGRGQREIREDKLGRLIKIVIKKTDLWETHHGKEVPIDTVIRDLLHTGIMTRQDARIRFWHDSFEDYLCAYNFHLRLSASRDEALADLATMKKEEVRRVFHEVIRFIEQMQRAKESSAQAGAAGTLTAE